MDNFLIWILTLTNIDTCVEHSSQLFEKKKILLTVGFQVNKKRRGTSQHFLDSYLFFQVNV